MRQETVKLLNSKRSETQMARSVNLAHISMVTASPALVPEKPFSPNKGLNVTIAGMLGLMLAVFGVFIPRIHEKRCIELSLEMEPGFIVCSILDRPGWLILALLPVGCARHYQSIAIYKEK
jgi:hypothetical protein